MKKLIIAEISSCIVVQPTVIESGENYSMQNLDRLPISLVYLYKIEQLIRNVSGAHDNFHGICQSPALLVSSFFKVSSLNFSSVISPVPKFNYFISDFSPCLKPKIMALDFSDPLIFLDNWDIDVSTTLQSDTTTKSIYTYERSLSAFLIYEYFFGSRTKYIYFV